MENTFARFHDMRLFRECLRELRRGQVWRPNMKIVVQTERKGHVDLPLSFTHARAALFQGVAVGAAVGLIAGIVISFVEANSRGIQPVFIAAFCFFGILMGGFAGALVGPMNPDPDLDKIEKDGDVVLAVESTEKSDIEWAMQTFRKWGTTPQLTTPAHGSTTVSAAKHPSGVRSVPLSRPSHG